MWWANSVFCVSSDRCLVTKGKALGVRLYRWCWLSTDTSPFNTSLELDQWLTNTLPTHYHCYCDWLMVDLSTDTRPTVKLHSASILTDSRTILDRHSTDIATDMSTTKLHLPLPSGGLYSQSFILGRIRWFNYNNKIIVYIILKIFLSIMRSTLRRKW